MQRDSSLRHEEDRDHRFRLSLLDGFEFREGGVPIVLPEDSERLLAFLAIKGGPVRRNVVARSLWPEATESQALVALDAVLSSLATAGDAVEASQRHLGLSRQVVVDATECAALAVRLLDTTDRSAPLELWPGALHALSVELLPGWCDDWAKDETDSWRQFRVHTLESLTDHLAAEGRLGEAAACAAAVLRGEPVLGELQAVSSL